MTIHGEPYYADLATMPHLLVAGATGSGKSVGPPGMVTSILYKATRDEVQFIFIDPKRIELGVYADIPHLKAEVVVEPKKAANALRWAVGEMERRYRMLAEVHVRSIDVLQPRHRATRGAAAAGAERRGSASDFRADDLKPLPYYVIVIDELADLMMVSANEVETAIARLAQMARAVGIHLIVATQRPSVDILTGTIKANFPCRISFATASRATTRAPSSTTSASEQLLGKGDMLFMPPRDVARAAPARRLHQRAGDRGAGALAQAAGQAAASTPTVLEAPAEERGGADGGDERRRAVRGRGAAGGGEGQASASFLQRRMRIGFSRAARLIDMMEQDGLLGPPQGSKPREVLVKPDYFEELAQLEAELRRAD